MRGQAHTLEATVAALLLLASLIFALQMTAVTPLSASTSSQHIENQQQATAQGVLVAAANNDALKPAILYWDNSSVQYHGATVRDYYTRGPPDNEFGAMLERAFNDRGIAYNVYFRFQSSSGDSLTSRYVYSGVASDNAVRGTHTVILTDNTTLVDSDGTRTETIIGNENVTYPIPDASTDGQLYNTVRVEVVAWRI